VHQSRRDVEAPALPTGQVGDLAGGKFGHRCGTSATPSTPTRGVGGGYQLAAGAALPPLVLDDEEAVAIASD
jgi:hypothetical protein